MFCVKILTVWFVVRRRAVFLLFPYPSSIRVGKGFVWVCMDEQDSRMVVACSVLRIYTVLIINLSLQSDLSWATLFAFAK